MNWLLLVIAASVMPPPGPLNAFSPDTGVFTAPVSSGIVAAADAVTIDAPAYTRTVTASSYTLTGTSAGTLGTDASAASVVLDLTFGGLDGATAITDRSPSPKAITFAGNAQVDTAQFKWGQASYLGDGGDDYVSTPDSADFDFGSGDFTIEVWTRWTSTTGFPTIINQLDAVSNTALSFYFGHDATNKMLFYAVGDDTLASVFLDSASDSGYTPTLNTWIHLAVVRNGSTFKMYADGVEIASAPATNTADIRDSANPVRIGDAQDACGTCSFSGHLDGLRVTKGVARYTAAFTPAEYPPGEVYWSASPSTTTGPCTGTDSFSCVVTVTPDAVGEGVETITVTRGAASDTETLGFYVAGAHSAFLSQSANGNYNSGLAEDDPVVTWDNSGSSGLDVTQAVGTAQPRIKFNIVGGQPVVRCDGGDVLTNSPAAGWKFLHDGTDNSVEMIRKSNGVSLQFSAANLSSASSNGMLLGSNVLAAAYIMYDAAGAVVVNLQPAATVVTTKFQLLNSVLDEGGATEASLFVDGTLAASTASVTGYSVTATQNFAICGSSNSLFFTNGDLFRVLIYQSALDSTQRGINKAVDEWALGGTLPVTP